jgi:hypothetical protein
LFSDQTSRQRAEHEAGVAGDFPGQAQRGEQPPGTDPQPDGGLMGDHLGGQCRERGCPAPASS